MEQKENINKEINDKLKVYNLIILDESGSMETIREITISSFNEVLQTIQTLHKESPEISQFISLITFNGTGMKTHSWNQDCETLSMLSRETYVPNASTPLYDTMGYCINKLKAELCSLSNYNVLVTVLTDGEENSSKEYSGKAILALIESMKDGNWTFTYMGANHDVEKAARVMGIKNKMSFEAKSADVTRVSKIYIASRIEYNDKLKKRQKTDTDFFDNDDSASF